MNRRFACVLISMIAMVLSGSALFAQQVSDSNEIPIYPGGGMMLEVRMTDRLIVPGIMSLTKYGGSYADKMKSNGQKKPGADASKTKKTPQMDPVVMKAALQDLQKMLSGLKELHIMLYDIPEKTAATDVVAFYTPEFKLDTGWNKLFETGDSKTVATVLEKKSKDGILCLGVFSGKVVVVRTAGTFNSTQVSDWINKYGADVAGAFMGSAFGDDSGPTAKKPAAPKAQGK